MDSGLLKDIAHFRIPMMCATRWNSQLTMAGAFVAAIEEHPELQDKLNAFKTHGHITAMELKLLKEFCQVMTPLKTMTDVFQKDHETVGLVIPLYLDVKNVCALNRNSRGNSCKEMATAMGHSLEKRMKHVLNDALYQLGEYILFLSFFSNLTI